LGWSDGPALVRCEYVEHLERRVDPRVGSPKLRGAWQKAGVWVSDNFLRFRRQVLIVNKTQMKCSASPNRSGSIESIDRISK